MSASKGTVCVTGASSGLGAVYAALLAARGHDLVLVARRAGRLDEVAAAARKSGVAVETLTADLSTPAGLAVLEARLEKGVYGLINNAGFGEYGPLATQNRDMLDEM